ncbi:MAG: phosphoenolpyruvate--protein phosphotransferase [Kiritimatiellae bacterium]|nr:phosphoenolpyruvate--protein phosphotransferase [Kiritimatiellia bacterium]
MTEQEMHTFFGTAVSRGFVSGPAYPLRNATAVTVPDSTVEDPEAELIRLRDAAERARRQIESLSAELKKWSDKSEPDIFSGHLMMLEDPLIHTECVAIIRQERKNAAYAVSRVAEKYMKVFSEMDDPYLKERSKDIADVSRRLIRNLLGGETTIPFTPARPCIVVADELTPSEVLTFPKQMVLGFATDRGSATSHAILLARALGIPTVVGLRSISTVVRPGDQILLDGSRGTVTVNPDSAARSVFAKRQEQSRLLEIALSAGKDHPGMTADGHAVPLYANADANTAVTELRQVNAEGIGLYRSEYLWIALNREPTEEEQTAAYTEVIRAFAPGIPVTIRVLDLGGDKLTAQHADAPRQEANPFLGNRSIRFLLRNPEIFRRQLRAILRASVQGDVRLMYPMIATLDELLAANRELERAKAELTREGVPFNGSIKTGSMIEIPSAALIAGDLAKHCDFFSIGTNDLIQYTLAADRMNEAVSNLYQPTHPAVLKLIGHTLRAAHERGIPVTVCGETAADPALALLLVGMGVDGLSMSAHFIPLVKYALKAVPLTEAQALAERCTTLNEGNAKQMEGMCREVLGKFAPEIG